MKPAIPNPRSGAFMFEDMLILLVLLGMAVFFVGYLLNRRLHAERRAPRINCVSNLKQIGLGLRMWSNDHGERFPMQVSTNEGGSMEYVGGPVYPHFLAASKELNSPRMLLCPEDKTRGRWVTNFAELRDQNLSYFVGVDASETNANHLLAGDYNLRKNGVAVRPGLLSLTANDEAGWTERVHKNCGNVGFADGSAQQLTSNLLHKALEKTGLATNRLAIP